MKIHQQFRPKMRQILQRIKSLVLQTWLCEHHFQTSKFLQFQVKQPPCLDLDPPTARSRNPEPLLIDPDTALQRHNTKTSKQIFPEKKLRARPQSQFPHSQVCERFIYSHDWSALSAAGKYAGQSWEYINRSQTHECGNYD